MPSLLREVQRGLGLFAAAQVLLLVNVLVEAELGAHRVEGGVVGLDLEVDEVAALDVAGAVGELAFAEVVDLLELGAGELHFTAEAADELFDGFFLALHVEDDHGIILALHRGV